MDQKDQIKQTLNIQDVISQYVELKKSGRNYKGICPFHSEKTPSFMVSPEIQIYKCFGCGESGDIYEFIQKIEGVEFYQAMELLADKAGIKLEKKQYDPNSKKKKQIYEINEISAKFYNHLLTKHPAGKKGLDYLTRKRNLTLKTINEFNLGYAPAKWDLLYKYLQKQGYDDEILMEAGVITKSSRNEIIDKFYARIIFPLYDNTNKIVGFTGRTLEDAQPKYLNTAQTLVFNKSNYIYGLDKAKIGIKQKGAVFVEGQMDVISCHQAKINNVVATSGTALTRGILKIIQRYTQDIIFAFDSDEAGRNAILRALKLAEEFDFNVKVAVIPDEFADIDEVLQKQKIMAVNIIEDAIPIYDFFIVAAVKNNDISTSIGKKKVMQELIPQFANLNDDVVKSHYIKLIAQKLQVSENAVQSTFEKGNTNQDIESTKQENIITNLEEETNLEEYVLALLFKAKLDITQNILYKLGRKDFREEENLEIFINFKDYVIGRKRQFDVKYFIDNKLQPVYKIKAQEIYLIDLGDLENSTFEFERELNSVFKRLKTQTIKKELEILHKALKDAEFEKDYTEVENLTKKVNQISKLKNQYAK